MKTGAVIEHCKIKEKSRHAGIGSWLIIIILLPVLPIFAIFFFLLVELLPFLVLFHLREEDTNYPD